MPILFGVVVTFVVLEGLLRLAGAAFLWVQSARNQVALDRQDTYRILCLGESTTALGGPSSYPSQLEQILNDTVGEDRFSVINRGVPGIGSAGILAQLGDNLDRYRPHAVAAMLGINDGAASIAPRFQVGDSWRVVKLLRLLVALVGELGGERSSPSLEHM